MSNILNKEKSVWVRPWNVEKFDNLATRDERFFALVIKGVLRWLTTNIVMYNKPIKHFIFNTGSSYMYMETNGYEFSWKETSGEDMMYMERPRAIFQLGNISINTEELTQPHIRGTYERFTENGNVAGFNAEMRRIPITVNATITYVLSNFNESVILIQEFLDKIIFQRYFQIIYLGQNVECSIEFPNNFDIDINKLDMTSTDPNNKTISISVNICTNYPRFDEYTEISNQQIISTFTSYMNTYTDKEDNVTDKETKIVD